MQLLFDRNWKWFAFMLLVCVVAPQLGDLIPWWVAVMIVVAALAIRWELTRRWPDSYRWW